MVESIFGFFNGIGYTHPLHPAITHIPVGMVLGAFILRFFAVVTSRKHLGLSAYHCVFVAAVAIPFVVFAGFLDWQNSYEGAWEFLIVLKMFLALLLAVILVFILVRDDPGTPRFDRNMLLYLVAGLVVVGLGFCGGELLYG